MDVPSTSSSNATLTPDAARRVETLRAERNRASKAIAARKNPAERAG